MITDEIRERLFALQDTAYRDFQSGLIPQFEKSSFIGVRTPALRTLAKEMAKREDIGEFLRCLPHAYFDENQLHAFILTEYRDFERCINEVCRFLPYVDNWATCDQLSPKVFRRHSEALLPYIKTWLASDDTYTVRYGIGRLMAHFLDDAFDPAYPAMVAAVASEEYYINMMRAWYFATALAKQYDAVLPYLEAHRLDKWTHNKTIQKAVESLRITPAQKAYLKTLKRK